jgi:hypothetical protein
MFLSTIEKTLIGGISSEQLFDLRLGQLFGYFCLVTVLKRMR